MPTLKAGYTPTVDAKLTESGYEVKRQFVVQVVSAEIDDDVELVVLNTNGLPEIGDSVSDDFEDVICSSLSCTPTDNGNEDGDFLTWYVDVTYKTPDGDGSQGAVNPLNDPTIISFGSTQYEKVVDKSYSDGDKEGIPTNPIENSVGDPYDPPITTTFANQYVTIQQNLSNFNPDWIVQFENTTNSSKMTIVGIDIEPYQARMISIRGNNAIDSNGFGYWVVSYEIEVNKEGFRRRTLNAGLNFIKENVGKIPIRYKDIPTFTGSAEEGEDFVNDPQKLGVDGEIITDPTLAVFREDFIYFAKKWNTLSIPSRA